MFSAKLEFLENRLSQVILDQAISDDRRCRAGLLAELTESYGARPKIESRGGFETFTWDTRDTTVVLRVITLDDKSEVSAVIYTSKASLQRMLKPNKL
jgi:hypothetical protein